jgi:formylaminopyrimidine deformylase / aminopyrimidine aminohydrolase
MKIQNHFIVIFVSVMLLSSVAGYGAHHPKTADQLIAKYQDAWDTATNHAFLQGVKDATLPEEAFVTWLGQDYHFASALIDSQCLILLNAPRTDQSLLIGGLFALEDELSWFEANASVYNIDLQQSLLPTCRAYADFLLALQYKPYVVQLVCLWALERVYFDAWSSALPCQPKYKEFVDRWTTPEFLDYVEGLENAVNNALAKMTKKELAQVEVYFLWVLRYEKLFWDMALTGQ